MNLFPPKKRGWFSRAKVERRKRMRKIQQQAIVNRAERNTQNPLARPAWEEELDRQQANFHMFGSVEGELDFNQVAVP
ncbi:hypothetical protein Hanom_Chr01g00026291 [Helianthus anomalus]